MHHHDTKRLPFSCRQLFDLVADIESYPAFVPGWIRVRILHAGKTQLDVEQQLQVGPVPLLLHSTAQLEDCRRILITSQDAPFGDMTIDWHFVPLEENHCEVSLAISLQLHAGPFGHHLSRLLTHNSDEMLPLFEKRAHSLYSVPGPGTRP